jgi:hypothetical protein
VSLLDMMKSTLTDLLIRLIVASGKVDYGVLNDNELVNPSQSLWTWKTVEDHVKETNGLEV